MTDRKPRKVGRKMRLGLAMDAITMEKSAISIIITYLTEKYFSK